MKGRKHLGDLGIYSSLIFERVLYK